MRIKYLKNKAGITITEVIIAILLLTFGTVGLFASLSAGFDLVSDIRENIVASSVIQEEMEELRKTSFDDLPPFGTSAFANGSLASLHNAAGSIDVDPYLDSNTKMIVITLIWNPRSNSAKQFTKKLVTVITRTGINSI